MLPQPTCTTSTSQSMRIVRMLTLMSCCTTSMYVVEGRRFSCKPIHAAVKRLVQSRTHPGRACAAHM